MADISTMTRLFENPGQMCRDLLEGLPDDLGPECLGFLTASSLAQHTKLAPLLQAELPFAVIGGTTLLSPLEPRDREVGASLTVLRKPGLRHAAVLSDPLLELDEKRQMEVLYERTMAALGTTPKLLLVIMPVIRHLSADRYLDHIFRLAGEIPVFGGMVSDDFDSDKFAVFGDGGSHHDRMLLVGLAGDIDPVWAVGCEVTPLSDTSPTITASYNNVIYGLDDMTFCDYLRRLGFHDDIKLLADFTLSIMISGGISAHDGLPEITHLAATDPALGCGIVGCDVTPGCRITLGHITRDNVVASTRHCLGRLKERMAAKEQQGYQFSSVFCLPCVGRYFTVMSDPDNPEGELIQHSLPPALSRFGYYGFNEVCPTRSKNNTLLNRPHSDSLVMCAW